MPGKLVFDFNCKIVERRSNSWLVSVVTGVTVAVPYIDTQKKKGKKKLKQTSSRMAPVANPSDRSEFLPNSPLSKSLVFSKWSVAPEETVIPDD